MDRETSVWDKKFLSGTASAESLLRQGLSRRPSSIQPTGGCLFDDAALSAPALPETPCESLKGDCRIASRPAGHILQILAPTFAAGIAPRLSELTDGGAYAMRSAGLGVWYALETRR
jgi:hypothetical protein